MNDFIKLISFLYWAVPTVLFIYFSVLIAFMVLAGCASILFINWKMKR